MRLNCKITAGGKVFNWVHSVNIERSREKLTDTCTIVIPKQVRYKGSSMVIGEDKVFKKGDSVKVELGYYPNLDVRFTGYIKDVMVDENATLVCEDEMYLLKREPITENFKKGEAKLADVLDKICPIEFKAVDTDLNKLRISRASPAKVLEELWSTYKIRSWVQDGVLLCGLRYSETEGETHRFKTGFNIIDFSNLKWRDKGDETVQIKGVSILDDDTKVEAEYPEGVTADVTVEFSYYNFSESALKAKLVEEHELREFAGFKGSITVFGIHQLNLGDLVDIEHTLEVQRAVHYVSGFSEVFSVSDGYRQTIEIDRRVE